MMKHTWQIVVLMTGLLLVSSRNGLADEKDKANANARMEAARKVYEGTIRRWKTELPVAGKGGGAKVPEFGMGLFEHLHRWSLRWMEAEQEASDKKADKIAAAESHLKRMTEHEKAWKGNSNLSGVERAALEFYRLEAEKLLKKAKE